jgi:hypothetical protein
MWRKSGKVSEPAWRLEGTLLPHRFRHTFARILLQRGVPVTDGPICSASSNRFRHAVSRDRLPERQARLTKILKDAFDDKPKPKLVAVRAGALERR